MRWGWLIGLLVFAANHANAGTVTMTIDTTPVLVGLGQSFDLTINVQAGAQPIDTVGAYVDFDPGIIQITGTTPGSTLPTSIQNIVDNVNGTVDYTATILAGTVTGSFAVVTLHVQAVGVGLTQLAFHHVLPRLTGAFLAGVDQAGSLTGATVVVTSGTPTETPPGPTSTRTGTRTPSRTASVTPTNTPGPPTATPTITRTPSVTATPTAQYGCVPAPGFCQPLSPTPTPLATPTSIAQPAGAAGVVQEELPGAGGCVCTVLYGQVFDVEGNLAINRRVTIEVTFEQEVDHCLIHISQRTYQTTDTGELPYNCTAIAGSTIHVALEGDPNPVQVVVPRQPRTALASLIGAVQVRPPANVLTDVVVVNGTDLVLEAQRAQTVITLAPIAVNDFTLTSDASAGNHQIANLGTATTAGDVLPFGQAAGGDFTGTFPNPTLARPVHRGAMQVPAEFIQAGQCYEQSGPLQGAQEGMGVAATPDLVGPSVFWFAFVDGPEDVRLRVCALAAVTAPATSYALRAY